MGLKREILITTNKQSLGWGRVNELAKQAGKHFLPSMAGGFPLCSKLRNSSIQHEFQIKPLFIYTTLHYSGARWGSATSIYPFGASLWRLTRHYQLWGVSGRDHGLPEGTTKPRLPGTGGNFQGKRMPVLLLLPCCHRWQENGWMLDENFKALLLLWPSKLVDNWNWLDDGPT